MDLNQTQFLFILPLTYYVGKGHVWILDVFSLFDKMMFKRSSPRFFSSMCFNAHLCETCSIKGFP